MPSPNDRTRAVNVLEKVVQDLKLSESQFLEDVRFSPASDERTKARIRTKLNSISQSLNWGSAAWPEVPQAYAIPLIIDALDTTLLESTIVRINLVNWLHKTRPDSAFAQLKRALGIEHSQDIRGAIARVDFRLSSQIGVQLCTLTGIPISYSRKGTTDERPPRGILQPIRAPPPLADFQEVVKKGLQACLDRPQGRGIVVMPTGSGKTRTTIDTVLNWAEESYSREYSILWIADRDELCDQAVETACQLAPSIISKEIDYCRYWHGNHADVQESERGLYVPGFTVTSVQQFRKRIENREPAAQALLRNSDVIIVDEAHRNLDWLEDLGRELDQNECDTRLIGLTATPFRAKTSETARIAKLFNHNPIVPISGGETQPGLMVEKLTESGILARRIDVNPADLCSDNEPSHHEISIIQSLLVRGCKSIIVFTNSVEEARTLTSILRLNQEMGVDAAHIDSTTPLITRRSIISSFRDGGIKVLFNYGILTTGFDAPGIDAVVVFRRSLDSKSSLFSQMVGRGLRGPRFGGTSACHIVHYRGM